jgi:hypothetical protein
MKWRVPLMVLLMSGISARAQSQVVQSSPVMDMLEIAKNALNNLQYTRARTTAREVLALPKLKRNQEIAALQVASAAYFPDEVSARMPDSATIFLKRLVRLMPAGQFSADLTSPALDSQLVSARLSTFGATARAPLQLTLKGTESRAAIEVLSTRPARWQLYLVSSDGPPILLDTLGSANSGRLSLRAHSGVAPIIQPGNYQLRILSIATSMPDTISLRFDASATGSIPTLVEMPGAPDASRFLPEKSARATGVAIAGGIIIGGVTWALANSIRPPKTLSDEPKDGRATPIAITIGVGALAAAFLDHGRPIPDNMKKNAATRTSHLKLVGDATETNRKRVSEFSLAITIDPELK